MSTTKSDRLDWLKSTDNNLKSQSQHLFKNVSAFRKESCGFIQLEDEGYI
jgi:hypothetical protein